MRIVECRLVPRLRALWRCNQVRRAYQRLRSETPRPNTRIDELCLNQSRCWIAFESFDRQRFSVLRPVPERRGPRHYLGVARSTQIAGGQLPDQLVAEAASALPLARREVATRRVGRSRRRAEHARPLIQTAADEMQGRSHPTGVPWRTRQTNRERLRSTTCRSSAAGTGGGSMAGGSIRSRSPPRRVVLPRTESMADVGPRSRNRRGRHRRPAAAVPCGRTELASRTAASSTSRLTDRASSSVSRSRTSGRSR